MGEGLLRTLMLHMVAGLHALAAAHPDIAHGRCTVAGEDMAGMSAVGRQTIEGHMLAVQNHKVGLLAHGQTTNGAA